MSKYIVVRGKVDFNLNRQCEFRIVDFVMFDPEKTHEDQMRKYAYRYFYHIENCVAKTLRSDVCKNYKIFSDMNKHNYSGKVCIFEHTSKNIWISFIPLEKLVNADYRKLFDDPKDMLISIDDLLLSMS